MNCFESRRLLLAAPRTRTAEQEAHIAACPNCATLLSNLHELDRSIENAALVPVPDALSHRVLLARRPRAAWHYAAAAGLAMASIVLGLLSADVLHTPGYARTTEAVGPTHPAVTAIAQVLDEELEHAYASHSDGPAELARGLKRLGLGLALENGAATAYYVGKCQVPGGGECDQIVLSTPDAHANVMLVADYPLPDRMLVADRRMIALVSPVARGGYIVVADSATIARRMEKLLIKG
ncbi:MAG TPA: DUF3379 family protein [Burkholderiales bacterium]|jgi:hypothetical protein|nr:DUF3379 family protein [Burkholderiales bacterium]